MVSFVPLLIGDLAGVVVECLGLVLRAGIVVLNISLV